MRDATQSTVGPFCQSCGRSLEAPEAFGTMPNGIRVNDYCRFCFHHGAFTEPSVTLEEMIGRMAQLLSARQKIPIEHARATVQASLPGLKRWRTYLPPHRAVA